MRKGYLVVSNGFDGDEGLTAFRQRRDSFAALRDVRVTVEARKTGYPLGMTTRKQTTTADAHRTVDLVTWLLPFLCGVGSIQG
jgi:hypothetical protein